MGFAALPEITAVIKLFLVVRLVQETVSSQFQTYKMLEASPEAQRRLVICPRAHPEMTTESWAYFVTCMLFFYSSRKKGNRWNLQKEIQS